MRGDLLLEAMKPDDWSSLAIWDVPVNTQRLLMDVELPPQVDSGLLFFFNGLTTQEENDETQLSRFKNC